MRKTNCRNGHYFDGDITTICPLCKEPEMTQDEKKGQKGFFTWFAQDKGNFTDRNDNPTVGLNDMVIKGNAESNKIIQPVQSVQPEQPIQSVQSVKPMQPEQSVESVQTVKPVQPEQPVQCVQPVQSVQQSQANSLFNELRSVSNSEDPKTVGIYMAGSSEPVVGWIVCVKGESQGESFEIYAGQNSLGRSMGNDIVLSKESSVSREKHAFITFDPQNLDFYIQKGDSSGLTYMEGKLIMSFEKLQPYSRLMFGNSEFVFVPFCGEHFRWDEYINV